MKQTPRTRKVNEAVREAIASIVLTEVADPRLDLVTVTSAEVSSDLSIANVYVTAHGDEDRYREMLDGLESAKGRIRSLLGRRVPMRLTPELRFFVDSTIDGSMRLAEALKDVPPSLRNAEPEDSEDAGDLDPTDPARAEGEE
ncbi:MAG: 30S ribosome-binding factor RbfA [Clostridiales bacterium]|nr:30S ribosome-binding factor RbfA [Clostridiales bacterium]